MNVKANPASEIRRKISSPRLIICGVKSFAAMRRGKVAEHAHLPTGAETRSYPETMMFTILRSAMSDVIRIVNARQHNLQGVTVDLPHRSLIVITGPSGSGKPSLAFDTLYAEGQRRY